jgi:ribosomal protein S16|tara:strand:+ start:100 stop:387 length:288 start_codon:yes stop_codon:yes gene_type:complete
MAYEHDQGHFTPLDLQEGINKAFVKLHEQECAINDRIDHGAELQDQVNDLFQRVDHLQRTVDRNDEKLVDMEKSLALFVHLISDKLGVSQGDTNE